MFIKEIVFIICVCVCVYGLHGFSESGSIVNTDIIYYNKFQGHAYAD